MRILVTDGMDKKAMAQLRDMGHEVVEQFYAPEELEKYGIATDPDLSFPDLFSQNHMSWVPTYHDEHGIMSWLTQQTID